MAKGGVSALGPAPAVLWPPRMLLSSPAAKAQRFNPLPPRPLPYSVPLPTRLPIPPPPHTIPVTNHRLFAPPAAPIPPPLQTVPVPNHRLFAPPAAAVPTPWLPLRLIGRTEDDRDGDPPQWISANPKGVRRGIRPRYMPNPYKGFRQRTFLVGPYLHHLGRYSYRSIGGFPFNEPLPPIPRFPLLEPFGPADLAP